MSWFWWAAIWLFGVLTAYAGYRLGLLVGRAQGFYEAIRLAEQEEDAS